MVLSLSLSMTRTLTMCSPSGMPGVAWLDRIEDRCVGGE